MGDDGRWRVLKCRETMFVISFKNVACLKLSHKAYARVKVFPDRAGALGRIWVSASTAHQAREIHKISQMKHRVGVWLPSPLHLKRSL
jgi:hypothetical protein